MNPEMRKLLEELAKTRLNSSAQEFVRILLEQKPTKKRTKDYLTLVKMTPLSFRGEEIVGELLLGIENQKYLLEV